MFDIGDLDCFQMAIPVCGGEDQVAQGHSSLLLGHLTAVRLQKWTKWHTGIAKDEVGYSGVKQLFSGLLVWSIFHNGTQVKGSLVFLLETTN